MPFDEEPQKPSLQAQKIGLKKVSSQKSVFENMPKKPGPEDFERQVQEVQQRQSTYKTRAADLVVQFNKAMTDKTLRSNKNPFQQEVEKELLRNMVQLAQEVNSDPNEREGEGSLSWIIILLKTCFSQRDRINMLEFSVEQLQKKTDVTALTALIQKEIQALDKSKKSE
jgi:hypothetical protein